MLSLDTPLKLNPPRPAGPNFEAEVQREGRTAVETGPTVRSSDEPRTNAAVHHGSEKGNIGTAWIPHDLQHNY